MIGFQLCFAVKFSRWLDDLHYVYPTQSCKDNESLSKNCFTNFDEMLHFHLIEGQNPKIVISYLSPFRNVHVKHQLLRLVCLLLLISCDCPSGARILLYGLKH